MPTSAINVLSRKDNMAMIALRVPYETARLLGSIAGALPGDSQAASDMHVTVAFLGDDVSVQQLASAMVACHAITSKTAPFMLTVSEISSFEPGENGTPVIMPIQSPELHTLEQALKAELDKAGVPYGKKWPEFKPHVTLSYIPGMKASGPLPAPLSWGTFDLTIYGANSGDGQMLVVLPFELPNIEVKMQKIAAKIAAML